MRPVLWVGAALLYAATAAAQQMPTRLTLADAVRLAVERNSDLRAAVNVVEAAQADRITARALPNPAFTFESEGRSIFRSSPDDGHEYSARVDQDLFLGARRRLQIQGADTGILVAEARLTDARRRLVHDVRLAYMQAVLATADQNVAKTSLEEIDRVIGLNRARFEQGAISGVEFRRLQVERLRFADDVFAAELASRNARSALLALLNMPNLRQPFELAEPLVPPAGVVIAETSGTAMDPNVLSAQAATARPDVAAATGEVTRASTETRLQRALRTPAPTLGGGYKHNGGNDTFVFGVTIPVPLFNRNAGAIARAEAERRAAENRAQSVLLSVNLDVQQAVNTVDVSRARVEYIERDALKNAQETRDIILASYRAGAITLIDFLDAQRAYRDTLRSYNRAVFDYRISLFQLETAVGAPPVRR
jgi:outer membrane protein, heavy metal efflux system